MFDFYTNVSLYNSNILYRGIKNGKRVNLKIKYSPRLFVTTNESSEWRTLHDEALKPMMFNTIGEARDFVKKYENVTNFKIYGNTRYEYAFIADTFRGDIQFDTNKLVIDVIDIEVFSGNGFPDPKKAEQEVTAIAIKRKKGDLVKTIVFGCHDYEIEGDEEYIQCNDEIDLCKKFIHFWVADYPDIITGWNTKFFDIPYMYNRINKLLGSDLANKMSPWNTVKEKVTFSKGKEQVSHQIVGVAQIDYLELYRWYAPGGNSQESYRLDHIANVELGQKKISYDEYDNLHNLYEQNYQKFIRYNIHDTQLVLELDEKLKLLDLGISLAYDTKSNYEDIFAQTRMWDAIIYNYLITKNIVVPPKVIGTKDHEYEGAYVKEPIPGMYKWVASFDLDSLYPHAIIYANISPETVIDAEDYTDEMRKIIAKGVSVDSILRKEIDLSGIKNATLTPNGQFFRTDKQGFLPEILETLYADRKKYKQKMIQAQKDYQEATNPEDKAELNKLISKYNNIQLSKKLSLNSAYGAFGSKYFRFYDLRQAVGVTTTGQLAIRWIQNKINEYMNSLLNTTNVDYSIYCDTDSLYLNLEPLVNTVYSDADIQPREKIIDFMDKVCEDKILPFIQKSYQEMADYTQSFKQSMHMKREKLSDKVIFTAKKRYILNVYDNEGVRYKKPKVSVTGLEMVKSSTPQIIREKMKELIHLMMVGTENDVQQFIDEFHKKFKDMPAEDVSFPRGVNGLSDYFDPITLYKKGTPIHVKGALLYNDCLKKKELDKKYQLIKEGDKLKFTYLKQPNPIKASVISFPNRIPSEFGLESYIDYETQFKKTFLEPIKTILDCVGWKAEKVNTLESFF